MYFELDRDLDIGLLKKALDILASRHPFLNRRLSRTLFGYRWTPQPQVGNVSLACQTCDTTEKRQIVDILKRNAWQNGFDVFREQQLRAYYLKTPSASYVQLVPNHVLADARSSDLLMADLAKIYNQLSQGHTEIPPHVDTSTSKGNLELFAGHLSFGKKLQFVFQALGHIVADAFKRKSGITLTGPRAKSGKRGETCVVSNEIHIDDIQQIKANLKQAGYTIHPLLVLSVLRAVKSFNERRGKKTDTLRVSDMFSLLPFSKTDLTNVYDCFVVPFTSYYQIKDDDLEMMASIRDELQYYKDGGILRELFRQGIYTASGTFSPKKLATNLVTQFVVKNNIVISNPGIVKFDIPDFGSSKIRSYTSFSQLFPPARIFFLFSTFRNILRLNILYDANAFSDDEVEKEIYAEFLQNMQTISGKFKRDQSLTLEAGKRTCLLSEATER